MEDPLALSVPEPEYVNVMTISSNLQMLYYDDLLMAVFETCRDYWGPEEGIKHDARMIVLVHLVCDEKIVIVSMNLKDHQVPISDFNKLYLLFTKNIEKHIVFGYLQPDFDHRTLQHWCVEYRNRESTEIYYHDLYVLTTTDKVFVDGLVKDWNHENSNCRIVKSKIQRKSYTLFATNVQIDQMANIICAIIVRTNKRNMDLSVICKNNSAVVIIKNRNINMSIVQWLECDDIIVDIALTKPEMLNQSTIE